MGLLTVPKSYTPRKGAPRESLLYVSAAERKMLKAMTDGKLARTKHGIMSAYMETNGGYKSGTSGIGTSSKGTSSAGKTSTSGTGDRGTPGMNQGSNGFKGGQGSQGSNGGTGQRGTLGMNQGSNAFNDGGIGGQGTNSRTSAMNSYNSMFNSQPGGRTPSDAQLSRTLGGILGGGGGISTPNASGSPYNNPASINVTPGNGSLQNAMTQRQAVNAMAPQAQSPNASMLANQYSQYRGVPPDVEDLTRAAYDRSRASQPLQAATGQPYGMQSPASNSFQSNLGYMDPQALADRETALSRGPGSVAGVMPGASPLSQQRTIQGLSGAMTDGGTPLSPEDVQNLSKTVYGEAGRESPMGQTAVANTMLNRMALAAAGKAKYMGGGSVNSLMGQYDATGPARAGGVPNQGFTSAKLGTDALGQGIASLAGAASPNSMFNTTAPATIRNATSFYNPKISNPKWGGSQFAALGNHVFGLPDELAGQGGIVSDARGTPAAVSSPTQVASINPAMGPPMAQQQPPSQPFSWSSLPGAGMVKAAYNAVDQNVIQPTQEQVAKYGGFERAGKLAQIAVAMSKFMPGGKGAPLGPGGQDRRGGGPVQNNGNQQPVTTPATPAPPPTVNPAAPQWYYPQYTQNWANLPTGAGGPIWHPSPPADGIFDVKTTDKKKKKPPPRGMLA